MPDPAPPAPPFRLAASCASWLCCTSSCRCAASTLASACMTCASESFSAASACSTACSVPTIRVASSLCWRSASRWLRTAVARAPSSCASAAAMFAACNRSCAARLAIAALAPATLASAWSTWARNGASSIRARVSPACTGWKSFTGTALMRPPTWAESGVRSAAAAASSVHSGPALPIQRFQLTMTAAARPPASSSASARRMRQKAANAGPGRYLVGSLTRCVRSSRSYCSPLGCDAAG